MDPYTIHELLSSPANFLPIDFTNNLSTNSHPESKSKFKDPYDGDVESQEDDVDDSTDANNGLIIGTQRVEVPLEVMELVLSYCQPRGIHVIGQVCNLWNSIMKRTYFWKMIFMRHKLETEWGLVGDHIHNHPDAWQVYLSLLKHRFLNRNLVKNHSGGEGFAGWTFMSGELDGWTVESDLDLAAYRIPKPPQQLPAPNRVYCFASNQFSCSKEQCIDLWKEGLTPPVMRACVPFCIAWSELVATPPDRTGIYEAKISFLDRDFGQISPYSPYEHKFRTHVRQPEWKKFSHKIVVSAKNAHEILDELRYFSVYHGAMDEQVEPNGNFGPKMANCSVTIELLPQTQTAALS